MVILPAALRHDEHEEHLGHLPHGHLAGGVDDPRLVQECVREVVVEREGDADEQRAEDEDREGAVLHELEGVEAQDVTGPHRASEGLRRGVGQEEGVDAQERGRRGGHPQRSSLGLDGQEPHDPAGGDPPEGAEDPDGRELLLRANHLVEGDGVHQGEGRDVAQGVDEEHPEEGRRVGDRRDRVEERGSREVQDAEDLLRREEPVGHHADDERGDDGPPGDGAVRLGGLGPGEPEALEEVGPHGDPPGAPDEELEEHHRRQAGANGSGQGVRGAHGTRFLRVHGRRGGPARPRGGRASRPSHPVRV